MSTIDWAAGLSGLWTSAANWVGDTVPGASDTAVIDAAASRHYTVTLNSPVMVGGIVLDQADAVLAVSSNLTSPDIDVEAGTLSLVGATVAGTIAQSGGVIDIGKGNTTLSDVTLAGPVTMRATKGSSTLTIQNGMTFAGSGTVALNTRLVLDSVSVLDNGTLSDDSTSGVLIDGKTPLTLGSHLTLDASDILLKGGQSITNDGTLDVSFLSGGTLTNNGTLAETATNHLNVILDAGSFTNNGLITASCEVDLFLQGLNAPGAGGSIALQGGALVLFGTLTTAQLLATFAQQRVTGTGNYGFGVVGALDNSGTTLAVGTGTTLGTLSLADITGGTIIDHGGSMAGGTLTSLTYQSLTNTLSLAYGTLADVNLKGATTLIANSQVTIQGGTLSGVGTISAHFLNLDGTDITGAGKSGKVLITTQAYANEEVAVSANQSVAGYTIDFTANSASFDAAGSAALDNATLNFSNSGTFGDSFGYDYDDAGNVSLGTHFVINIAAGSSLALGGVPAEFPPAPILTNQGTMAVAGTLALGGSYAIANLDNTGIIDISSGGTMLASSNPDTILTNGGVIAATDGTLDLTAVTNTGLISATFKTAPGTATIAGSLTGAGTVALTGTGTLALGGTVAAGQLISLGSGTETMLFTNTTADTGFGGTIGGFAKGDSITFTGETLTAASFVGQSIVATLSTGGTIALATTSALSGGLSVTNAKGNASITYTNAEASGHGWSGGALAAHPLPAHWEPSVFDHGGAGWREMETLVWPVIGHGH